MIETCIKLTEEQFIEQYPLVPNHLNPNATWGYADAKGCLFETYGEELEFIKRQNRHRVWTILDGDDGDMYVASGFHFVNRVGYLVSRDPVPYNTFVEVHIPMQNVEVEEDDQ